MKNSNLFWGGILVALGVIFILSNFDFLNFNWWGIFRLWPMLLILLGVTLLPIKNAIKIVLTLILLAITIALLLTNTSLYQGRSYRYSWDFGDNNDYVQEYKRSDQSFFEPYSSDIEEATLDIEAVAGEFIIRGNTDNLVDFRQDGNIGPYVFSTNKEGNHQYLRFEMQNSHFRMKRLINDVDLQLNDNPVWNINLECGAAKIDLDLSKYKARNIDIQGGASSTHLKLGSLYAKTDVKIESGASSITIAIPEDTGCELTTQTVLSSKNFDGFTRLERGLYQTDNFESAQNKIYIDVEAAVTSLKVRRY